MTVPAAEAPAVAPLAPGRIARFWSPLAATWVMMAMEGPFVAAAIARLPDPKINLAAHGVAFAIAIVVEAPVMMLMSTSTALVRDRESFRRLRMFSRGVSAFATLMLCVLLIPWTFDAVAVGVLRLPEEVASLTYGCLWIYLPWAAAIGYRRFLHGLMIRSGKTRQVAAGTVLRLATVGLAGVLLSAWSNLPGAWVGAASLTIGVCAEAVVARCLAVASVRRLLARPSSAEARSPSSAEARSPSSAEARSPSYGWILRFYFPLALTSLIGLAAQPMLTFFMGRAQAPLESLAVFPVVHALSFLFRALGISYQEAAIALLGDDRCNRPAVGRFAVGLAAASSAGLALVAFTPLFGVWFETVSGLTPELAGYARAPVIILAPMPALAVWLSYQRAKLVLARRTARITVATALEVAGVATVFASVGWGLELPGVTAAALSFLCGRILSNLYMHFAGGRP